MAISPSIEQITLYNNEGNIYLFSSKFDKKKKEVKFENKWRFITNWNKWAKNNN